MFSTEHSFERGGGDNVQASVNIFWLRAQVKGKEYFFLKEARSLWQASLPLLLFLRVILLLYVPKLRARLRGG